MTQYTLENENPVELFLKENTGKNLSFKTIYNNLKIKRRKIRKLIFESNKIKQVEPLEVGSRKYRVNVYRYID